MKREYPNLLYNERNKDETIISAIETVWRICYFKAGPDVLPITCIGLTNLVNCDDFCLSRNKELGYTTITNMQIRCLHMNMQTK
jgi:hypothetical protein